MKKTDLLIAASAGSTICAVITMCIFLFSKPRKKELLSAALVFTSLSDLLIGISNYMKKSKG